MVLVMQPHVVGEQIQRAVIRERLWDRRVRLRKPLGSQGFAVEDVVLGDEVPGAGVQGAGEEGGQDQVDEGRGAAGGDEEVVEEELGGDVEQVQGGERQLVDEHGPQGVEEDLEGAEEGFAEEGVEEEGFERGGQVGVEAVDAEGFVVGEVIRLFWGGRFSPSFSIGGGSYRSGGGGTHAECCAVGEPDGQVGEDGEEPVGGGGAEG